MAYSLIFIFLFQLPLASAEDKNLSMLPAKHSVTLDLKDADLRETLGQLGRQRGINMIIAEEVRGNLTANLRDVPFWEALGSILRSKGCSYEMLGGGTVFVKPLSDVERAESEIVVHNFRLKYLTPSSVLLDTVRKLLSSRGEATVLEATNSLIVKDVRVCVERVESLLAGLDIKPSQVMIEARLVEVSSTHGKDLGIDWLTQFGYTSNDVFGRLGTVDTSFGVNLPSKAEEGLALGLGIVSDRLSLDMRISALEETGAARTLSRPSVMVRDNHEAVITSGTDILVPTVEATTVVRTGDGGPQKEVESEIFSAYLELAVTPRVVTGQTVSLTIDTRREEFDFSREVEGFPPKNTRSARTTLLVGDGHTIVIGGIYTEKESSGEGRVPYLSNIPFIGSLFRKTSSSKGQSELLIFLTPTIIADSEK